MEITSKSIIENHKTQSTIDCSNKSYGKTITTLLQTQTEEYKSIEHLFNSTKSDTDCILYGITRTSNQYFEDMYHNQLQCTIKKNRNNANEKVLFHGTNMGSVDKIMKSGYDDRYSDTTAWGEGTYHAVGAKLSQDYCKPAYSDTARVMPMFVNKCCLGDSCVGHPEARNLYKTCGFFRYDSFCDNQEPPTQYVTFTSFQSIPMYIIYWSYDCVDDKNNCSDIGNIRGTTTNSIDIDIDGDESKDKSAAVQTEKVPIIITTAAQIEQGRNNLYAKMGLSSNTTNNGNNRKKRKAEVGLDEIQLQPVKRRKLNEITQEENDGESDDNESDDDNE
eukprot:86320_1